MARVGIVSVVLDWSNGVSADAAEVSVTDERPGAACVTAVTWPVTAPSVIVLLPAESVTFVSAPARSVLMSIFRLAPVGLLTVNVIEYDDVMFAVVLLVVFCRSAATIIA